MRDGPAGGLEAAAKEGHERAPVPAVEAGGHAHVLGLHQQGGIEAAHVRAVGEQRARELLGRKYKI